MSSTHRRVSFTFGCQAIADHSDPIAPSSSPLEGLLRAQEAPFGLLVFEVFEVEFLSQEQISPSNQLMEPMQLRRMSRKGCLHINHRSNLVLLLLHR